jgi:hypothetical protein
MLRSIFLPCLLALAGCTLAGGAFTEPGQAGQYDFNWRLSGDPAVAPLQVFGTARQIWLQFPPGQAVPAIFASTPQGDLPLVYRRQDPYVVIDGNWQSLVLRGGRYVARAARQDVPVADAGDGSSSAASKASASVTSASVAAAAASTPLAQASAVRSAEAVMPGHRPLTEAPPRSTGVTAAGRTGSASQSATVLPSAAEATAPIHFRAGPPEATLRGVLARWASSSGWTFEPQHWAVDVDIPLAGTAEFPDDFKQAVRDLLASTELSEKPVQPCFYSNRVLRVVPYTQACDRSVAPLGAAS